MWCRRLSSNVRFKVNRISYDANWRSLDHSTIIYESPQVGLGSLASTTSASIPRASSTNPTNAGTPLLRLSPCSKDANLLATFHLDSSTVLVLDIRQPGKELYNLVAHAGNINAGMFRKSRHLTVSSLGTFLQTRACKWRR